MGSESAANETRDTVAGTGEERRVARAAGMVGAATMTSRVLGLVREQVMAAWFGAGLATDAFNVAFRIPNLLRDLFAEGAMSSAFVPKFMEVQARRGSEAALEFGRRLLLSLVVFLSALCLIGGLAAPWLVAVFAPGFASIPGKVELTVALTRVMLPFLPLIAAAAVCMAMLNARGRFLVPALAPALQNLLMVGAGLALIPACLAVGWPAIAAMAIGVVIGGLGQLAWQLAPLFALGFRWRWEPPSIDPDVRRVAAAMVPATIGLAATQLNLFVSTVLASLLPQGSVSWLWYAFRLMQLPIGVFGVALGTVSLPSLSRAAVAGDMTAVKTTLSATLRLVLLLTLPAAVWLAVAAHAVIALLYQHGRFTEPDTAATAGALVMYCVGLPAFAAVGVLTRTFYALGDTRTPVRASFVAVAANLALNLTLMGPLAHWGLALATSLTSIVNLLQLAFGLRRKLGDLDGRRVLSTLARVAASSAIGGAAAAAALLPLAGTSSLSGRVLAVLAAGLAGLVVTVVAMKLLRVSELATVEDLARGLLRRFRR
jgi:putative peptidoglycan lipid II flippase